ncbi:protein phosphatase PHLPP-like protein [Petromyzon marinus]|uniref:Leucine-rich repeat-containing G-protein coupled receptor 5A-like n=1 Tax=Petromyzon marinus TaxID=7757 RepID=A0AAJ7SVI1_PETMA|nr:leucine-rich repeat-containing G-protein coupled receptor 5A-like [Petromyzon marinus]
MTKRKTMLVSLVFMTSALLTAETYICKEPGKPINLRRSNYTKVPLWNNSCHSVKIIDLSGNSIGYIGEASFRLIQNLTILYLNASGLQNISENAFGGNTCLEELYLQENKLSEFPMKLIQHLPKLRTLSIYSNRFLKINGFSSLNAQLEMLSLGPQQTMHSLDTLDFRHLSSLKVLNLTKMNIVNVPHFHPSSFIEHIDLSSNDLEFNANDFENCERLKSISFKACNIDKLVFDLFKSQKNLKKLDLTENPLKSDFHTNYAVIRSLVDKRIQVEVTCLECSNWCNNIFPTLKIVCNAHEKKYNWCLKQCPQNSAVNNGNKHRESSINYTLLIICILMVMLFIFITTIIFCKMKGSRKLEILRPEGSSHITNTTYT